MYEEFRLDVKDLFIMGYHWRKENPAALAILIHGIGEHGGRFDRMGECLKTRGIASLALDLRGHGCSAGKRGHAAPRKKVLSDVDRLIEYGCRQYPNIPIALYGHSLGGNIALDYRKRGGHWDIPAAYVASSPWLMLERKVPRSLYAGVKCMAKVKPDFQMSAEIKTELLANPKVLIEQKHLQLVHNKITAEAAMEGYDIGKALINGKLDRKGKNGPCDAPLLLMHGSDDRICSPKGSRMLAELEGESCRYMEWPGYFHELHNGCDHEDGEAVMQAMADWILSAV